MNARIPIDFIGSPAHLPRVPKGRVAVLDVAFASGEKFELVTDAFIQSLNDRLVLWCDHHEHGVGWAKYRGDPRFVLVPNREAHACPELITPEVAARAGTVDRLLVHGDFDGLLTAVKLLLGGRQPYADADEDARAIDSPGRGHVLSARGARLAHAVDEAVASFTAGERRDFLETLVWSLADGQEPDELTRRIDAAAAAAEHAQEEAIALARDHGRPEQPGLFVVRLEGRRKGRIRKGILRYAEEHAAIGVVVETEPHHTWLTAATFDERIDLNAVDALQGGRSDYRYCEPKGPVDPILQAISRAARDA